MIYEADIPTLHKMLSEGYITCRELTEFYLERIEAYNDTYNCFITLCPDVLDEADKKDELIASGEDFGLMYGIPIVIKDNIDLSGYVTSNGESLSRESASEDAEAVSLLREAGAVVIRKDEYEHFRPDGKIYHKRRFRGDGQCDIPPSSPPEARREAPRWRYL